MKTLKPLAVTLVSALALSACAGRAPDPITVSQPQDRFASCTSLQSEIVQNNNRISSLSGEENGKIAQNIVAGTVGLILFWPALFAMDFQDAAGTEKAALNDRNTYLTTLAARTCVDDGTTPDQQLVKQFPGRLQSLGKRSPRLQPVPMLVQQAAE